MPCFSVTKKGFTLIELLVVIAIIAILAAILFPVFARAREKARQSTCTSNQRQISASIQIYSQDHEETLPGTATIWKDISVDPGVLICPTKGKNTTNGYVYYGCMGGQGIGKFQDPTTAGLTADGQHISTIAGDPQLNIAVNGCDLDFRHSGKVITSFVDGHVSVSDNPPPPVFGMSTDNLRVWYAADAICGLTSGSGVQNWKDLGQLNRPASQLTVANRPTYQANAINGKPALSYNGNSSAAASNWLATPQQFDLMGGSANMTIFAVINPGATQNSYSDIIDFDHGTSPFDGFVWQMKDGTPVNSYSFTYSSDGSSFPTWANPNIVTLTANQPQVVEVVQNSSNIRYFINGVLKTTFSPISPWNKGLNVLTIGNFTGDHSRCFNGLIAEIAIYNKAMSDTERQDAENYLKGKYGL